MITNDDATAPINDLEDGESTEFTSSSGSTYMLKNVGGVYSCTCPAWRFQKDVPIEKRTCKHLRSFRGDAAETTRTSKPSKVGVEGTNTKNVKVMSAHKYRDVNIDPTGWFISEKLDGMRGLWDGKDFWTRNGKLVLAPEWFKKQMPPFPLDGEFWIERGAFERVSGIARRQDCPDEWKEITYMVFDSPTEETFLSRMLKVSEFHVKNNPPCWKIVDQIECKGEDHLNEVFQAFVAKGGEGVMVRDPSAIYSDARVNTILKLKPLYDAEARITGYTDGKGKYKGMVGAYEMLMPDGNTFNLSGMEDELRKNPIQIGTVITYQYEGFTNTGKPKFARYHRVRSDLTWEDVIANHEKDERPKPQLPKEMVESVPAEKKDPVKKVATRRPVATKESFNIEEGKTYRFEYVDDKSNKFWEVRVDGNLLKVAYGRIGTAGRTENPVEYGSTDEAIKEATKKIKSKTGKGYVPVE